MGIWVNKTILDKFWKKCKNYFVAQSSYSTDKTAIQKAISDGDAAVQLSLNSKESALQTSISTLGTKHDKDVSDIYNTLAAKSDVTEEIEAAVDNTLLEVEQHLIPRFQNMPTALRLVYLSEISTANKETQYIRGELRPTPEYPSLVFQRKEGENIAVHPTTGKLSISGKGTSSFYIYSTLNTSVCEEATITVRAPKIRVSGGVVRLCGNKLRIV